MPSSATKDVQRAQKALTSSPIHALRDLHVEQAGDSLVLSGRVGSFYHKQLAQEVVRSACHEVELMNFIDVDRG
jgi:hypothetical protein